MSGLVIEEVSDGTDTVSGEFLLGGQLLFSRYGSSDAAINSNPDQGEFNISTWTDLGTAVYGIDFISSAASGLDYAEYGNGNSSDRPTDRYMAGGQSKSYGSTFGTFDIGSGARIGGGSCIAAYGEYA